MYVVSVININNVRFHVSNRKNSINYPEWTPKLSTKWLGGKTVCPSYNHNDGIKHRDVHNLYGLDHSMASNIAMSKIMPDLRPFILSRSVRGDTIIKK